MTTTNEQLVLPGFSQEHPTRPRAKGPQYITPDVITLQEQPMYQLDQMLHAFLGRQRAACISVVNLDRGWLCYYCKRSIGVAELTTRWDENKPATFTRQVGDALDVPAFLIRYPADVHTNETARLQWNQLPRGLYDIGTPQRYTRQQNAERIWLLELYHAVNTPDCPGRDWVLSIIHDQYQREFVLAG